MGGVVRLDFREVHAAATSVPVVPGTPLTIVCIPSSDPVTACSPSESTKHDVSLVPRVGTKGMSLLKMVLS